MAPSNMAPPPPATRACGANTRAPAIVAPEADKIISVVNPPSRAMGAKATQETHAPSPTKRPKVASEANIHHLTEATTLSPNRQWPELSISGNAPKAPAKAPKPSGANQRRTLEGKQQKAVESKPTPPKINGNRCQFEKDEGQAPS